jgi:hypothetical protein
MIGGFLYGVAKLQERTAEHVVSHIGQSSSTRVLATLSI